MNRRNPRVGDRNEISLGEFSLESGRSMNNRSNKMGVWAKVRENEKFGPVEVMSIWISCLDRKRDALLPGSVVFPFANQRVMTKLGYAPNKTTHVKVRRSIVPNSALTLFNRESLPTSEQ